MRGLFASGHSSSHQSVANEASEATDVGGRYAVWSTARTCNQFQIRSRTFFDITSRPSLNLTRRFHPIFIKKMMGLDARVFPSWDSWWGFLAILYGSHRMCIHWEDCSRIQKFTMVEDPFWGIDSLTQYVTNFDVHAGDPITLWWRMQVFVCVWGERERERERESKKDAF